MNHDWKSQVKAEDFVGDFGQLVEIIGIENAVALSEFMGGIPLYIPKMKRIKDRAKKRAIREGYAKGASITQLARKHRVTERHIYQTTKDMQRPNNGKR